MLALGEICFEGMGAVEKGFEVLVLGEMCFHGMGAFGNCVGGVGIG